MRSKLKAVICASILFTACTGGNDQVATLPLTNEERPVEVVTEETTAETTETTVETTAEETVSEETLRRKLPQKFSKPLKPNLQRILTPCSMLNLHRFRKQAHLFPIMQSRLSKTCSKMRRMCTALSLTISMRTETPK